MSDTKFSGGTPLNGSGAVSRGAGRAGSTTAYRTVDNVNATVDPTVTDDSALFYHVGSMWQRSDTGEMWTCKDATASAAVWVPRQGQFGSAKRRFYAYTDCLIADNTLRSDFFTPTPSGTGAGVTVVDYSANNAVGVLSLDLGTTTSGRVTLWGASTAGTAAKAITFGRGRARFRAKLAIPVLSNGTDTFTTRVGFLDSQIGNATNGAWFRYTHGTNSGKWEAVTRDNAGTETAADTGVTVVATTWQEFTIDVNAAGTSAVFSIDGVVVATITTTIPTTAGRSTSYGVIGLKSAGTTATAACQLDYIEVQQDLTTAR